MKGKKLRIIILAAVCMIAIIVATIILKYMNLETFVIEQNGDLVSPNGVIYKFDGKLTSDYMGGDLKSVKAIGKIKGDGFWGRRIYKLKGIEVESSIAIRGLMLQEVETNEKHLKSDGATRTSS